MEKPVTDSAGQPLVFQQITDDILAPLWKPGRGYFALLLIANTSKILTDFLTSRLIGK